MLRPCGTLCELDSMTWIPVRPAIQRGALTASLALVVFLLPVGARATRAYVSNEDDGTVTVIDTQRLAALATVTVGKRPRGLVLSPDGASLYVALTGLPKCHVQARTVRDRKSTRLNSSHLGISYAGFCLKQTNVTRVIPDTCDCIH